MKSKLAQNWALPPTWLRFLVITLLVLGVFFRFVNLDRKVYWHDETLTSLTISGYTRAEMIQQGLDDRVMGIRDLQKYQRPSAKGALDTVKSLAIDFPEHPPLYYLLVRLGTGNSVAAIRSVSALISLLAFPCMYWLCLELFDSPLVGWIAIALIAVSPFHVLYAQEAREYSLWTVTILLSSAALLRAIRLNTPRNWIIYAGTLGLAFYSYAFSVFIALGHAIYVAVIEKKLTKTAISYLLASLVGLLAFMPWLLTIIANLSHIQETMKWANQHMPISYLVSEWIYNLSYVFVDFWFVFTYVPNSPWNWQFGKYLIPLILVLVGYAIYFLCRRTPRRVWLFVLTLIGVTALALMLPDLIKGGYRSTQARYLTPAYIGIELAVAYAIAAQINPASTIRSWQQKLWKLVFIALISGGILSCAVSSQAETWWNKKTTSSDDLQVAGVINRATHPLLLTEAGADITGSGFTLSYLAEPKVQLLIVLNSATLKIPDRFSDVFVYEPSKGLRSKLEQQYKVKVVYQGRKKSLWKLEQY